MRELVGVGFDAMRQRVQPRGRGHRRRHAKAVSKGSMNAASGTRCGLIDAFLQLRRLRPAEWRWAKLRCRCRRWSAGRRGTVRGRRQQIDAENFREALPAARERGDEFGDVHRAAAADAEHGSIDVFRARHLQRGFEHGAASVRADPRRGDITCDAGLLQRLEQRLDSPAAPACWTPAARDGRRVARAARRNRVAQPLPKTIRGGCSSVIGFMR